MEITVSVSGVVHSAEQATDQANYVVVDAIACPHCGEHPLRARGVGAPVREHSSLYNDNAETACCQKPVDWIRVELDTIFGLEEDERVLNGAWKVY